MFDRFFARTALAAALSLIASPALAGSNPGWTHGYVPTAAQWNAEFASKQDDLGYVPINKAGDSMFGRLGLFAATADSSGLNIGVGVTPTAPKNGDVWMTTLGVFYRNNGVTVGPLFGTSAASALSKVDDTNVTATLSGTPGTALLQPVTITFGWTGTLAVARLNANVVQAITNDTNVHGSIAAQNLTLSWAGQLSIARGGTGASTVDGATQALLPPQSRTGGIVYWDNTGGRWTSLAGNNAGTRLLQEDATGTPSWVVAGTGTVTSVSCFGTAITASGTCITTGQIPGTATNDNATAGNVGEYKSAIVLSAGAVNLTSGTAVDITALSLTAGDWDVSGLCATQPTGAVVTTVLICNITTTANTLNNAPSDGGAMAFNNATQTAGGGQAITTDVARVSIAGTVTYHLVTQTTWSGGTSLGGYGKLRARRVR